MDLYGKIDENGIFYLLRDGKMKKQYCPFVTDGSGCGEWCPLFMCIEEMYCNAKVTLCHKEYHLTLTNERDEE